MSSSEEEMLLCDDDAASMRRRAEEERAERKRKKKAKKAKKKAAKAKAEAEAAAAAAQNESDSETPPLPPPGASDSDSDEPPPAPKKKHQGKSLAGFLSQFRELEKELRLKCVEGLKEDGLDASRVDEVTRSRLRELGVDKALAKTIAKRAKDDDPFPKPAPPPNRPKPKAAAAAAVNHLGKSGILNKLGGFRKTWKARHFQVDGDTLEYWACDPETLRPLEKKGEIPLLNATITEQDNLPGKSHCFGVKTLLSQRTYVMEAGSDEERTEWMEHLVQVAQRKKAKSGMLYKLGERRRTWKRRLFQRNKDDLEYWETDANNDPVRRAGSIALFGCTLSPLPFEEHGRPFTFGLRAAGSKRVYVLQAEAESDYKEWMDYLKRVIDEVGAGGASVTGQLKRLSMGVAEKTRASGELDILDQGKIVRWVKRFVRVQASTLRVFASAMTKEPVESLPMPGAVCAPVNEHAGEALSEAVSVSDVARLVSFAPFGARDPIVWQADSPAIAQRWVKDVTAAVAAAPLPPKTSLAGYLRKQGGLNKALQERYFMLQGCHLRYFKRFDDEKPAGEIVLLGSARVEEDQAHTQPDQDMFAFSVFPAKGKRKYLLFAISEGVRKTWMRHITHAIAAS